MSRYKAAIDIGTNTFRYMIADKQSLPALKIIAENRRIVRLGQGLKESGGITQKSMQRALLCMEDFAGEIASFGVDLKDIYAAATSAVRDADNSDEFQNVIKAKTGINVEILSGKDEGKTTLLGIKQGLAEGGCGFVDDFVAIDIGGGSTEFIYSRDDLPTESLNLGVVHLTEKYLKSDPPLNSEIANLKNELENSGIMLAGDVRSLVGTAGTITTLAFIDSQQEEYIASEINGYLLEKKSIAALFKQMITMTNHERLKKYKIEKGREDIILSGILILLTIMEKFDYNQLRVSDYGLREGLLLRNL